MNLKKYSGKHVLFYIYKKKNHYLKHPVLMIGIYNVN